MLSKGKSPGIFLDKYTFMYVVQHAIELQKKNEPGAKETADFFLKKTVKTRLSYTGEEMSYGMWLQIHFHTNQLMRPKNCDLQNSIIIL